MDKIRNLIQTDLDEAASVAMYSSNPYLTYEQVRAILVLIRRMKVRLELLEAEYEKS